MSAVTEERFLRDVAGHQIQILRDDGVNRHVRFRKPGTICMGFDLITWPGYLCYCGDMGTYIFHRLEDMFCFFRAEPQDPPGLYINTGYWAEKIESVDRYGGVEKFSPEEFESQIRYCLKGRKTSKEMWEAVEDDVLSCADEGEQSARKAASDFKFDGEYVFADFWEMDCTVYTDRFVWCCYALAWGVQQYDNAKKEADHAVAH